MRNLKNTLAYVIGVAIGDGNLSNPNGRAIRLRITCDLKYKKIIKRISLAIKKILPKNKVSIIYRAETYCDISCYSNKWESWLGWKAGAGSKYKQGVSVPKWIKLNKKYTISCLRGLFETDGSIYTDRKYVMTSFVTIIPQLADDTIEMIKNIGFSPKIYRVATSTMPRYNIRISKDVNLFLKTIKLEKK